MYSSQKLDQATDPSKHPEAATVREAIEKSDKNVIVADTAPSLFITDLNHQLAATEASIKAYDKQRAAGTIPPQMTTTEKAERSDNVYLKEEIKRWENLDKNKKKVMGKVSEYVESFLKAFDSTIPGVGDTKMVLMPKVWNDAWSGCLGYDHPHRGSDNCRWR